VKPQRPTYYTRARARVSPAARQLASGSASQSIPMQGCDCVKNSSAIIALGFPSPAQWVTVNRIRVKDSYTDMEFLSDEFSEKFVPIGFI
jgi:hypothetical protein